MGRRLVIFAYDALSALAVAVVASCAFVVPAYAYIDPSVMTYTIQAVAGVVVALSAVMGVAFRRGRKGLMRILDIDENAKKEQEPDVHRVGATQERAGVALANADSQPANGESAAAATANDAATTVDVESIAAAEAVDITASEQAPESAPAIAAASASQPSDDSAAPTPSPKRAYKPTVVERLIYGFIAAFFFVFTVYFVAPLEIVAGASSDLVYSMGDVWWTLLLPDLGIVVAITLVLTALRGRAFSIGLMLVFALGLCGYIQALFLNFGLPAADGNTIIWSDYMAQQVISAIVWVAVIAAAVVYGVLHQKRAQGIAVIASVFLVVVQGIGLVSLAINPAVEEGSEEAASAAEIVMTEDQMYTVNPKHNVIVFILDTYDTAYLKRILREMNPNLLDGLTGFTNYENATSAMIPTRFAIPEMLTGQMPDLDEPFSVYTRERYARGTFLDAMYDANYSIGLYTDSMRISGLPDDEQLDITSKTVNMHPLENRTMDYGGTLYALYQMGQYRDVPWVVKWAFWYYTDQVNRSFVASDEDEAPENSLYVMDDVRYYNRLCQFGLSLEEGEYDGAFRFIHLLGSHYPFSYDENANFIGDDESNVFRQSQGAIHIVTEYINQLKELGVYENTTIIITADHGYWTITLEPIEETSTPIMFVKGEQSAELDALPMVTDEKPVSHLDLQATVLDAMGLDWSEYAKRDEWQGYSMFGPIDPNRLRYYLTTDSEPNLDEVQFREYLIDGNALDWNNWSETGRTLDART